MLYKVRNFIRVFITIIIILLLWEVLVHFLSIPSYFVPPPSEVFMKGFQYRAALLNHLIITATEAISGFLIGVIFGYLVAVIVVHVSMLRPVMRVITVSSQSIPKIAIAPLIVMWLGFGLTTKIFFSALICFFPILVSSAKGMLDIDNDVLDYIFFLKPNKWNMFWLVRFPNSIPMLFNGMKIAVPLCLIGAIVGEFIISDAGLGYLIQIATYHFNMGYAFAILFVLSALGLSLYSIVLFLEKTVLEILGLEQKNFEI